MFKISNKFYILAFVPFFAISTAVLLIASTLRTPVPAWVGYLDVGIVVLISVAGFTIHQRNKNSSRYDVSHQLAIYLFPLVLVGMWIYRESIDFHSLLTGAARRTFFWLSILPRATNLWKAEQTQ